MRRTNNARRGLGIRGQLMFFLCFICLFLLVLFWILSTQLLEPLYTRHIERQLTTQAENVVSQLDDALAEGTTLSSWSFGRLYVNTGFFDKLAMDLYSKGALSSFCVDISDSTLRQIYKIENQSYCNLHETYLSDASSNEVVNTAIAMRKKCRTSPGGFKQTLNPPRLSGSAQLLVGRTTADGSYTVLVTTSLVHVAEASNVLSTLLPLAAALIFVFAMSAAWLFSEWFTKPLRQLSRAARQMAKGNYAVQVESRRSDELPDSFIEKVRAAVKRVGPEKFLLGEVWEDATTKFGFDKRRTYLLGKGLDSVMNYPFKNAVLDFVKGKPAEQAMNEIMTLCEHYPAPAMDTALNFLSTHDTERALTVIADEPANGRGREWQSGRCVTGDAYEEGILRLKMAYAIIYTLPGVPCLYYGDEIGMQGYRDPFNRGYYCWDSHEKRLRPVLAQLAQLRHTCEAFHSGALRVLRADGGVLHYQRIGLVDTAEIIVNRTEHIIVEPLASGKHTEVNPMGFTIVVEEAGHNPNHSYYDYK